MVQRSLTGPVFSSGTPFSFATVSDVQNPVLMLSTPELCMQELVPMYKSSDSIHWGLMLLKADWDSDASLR